MLTTDLHLLWPLFMYSVRTWGQRLLYWTGQVYSVSMARSPIFALLLWVELCPLNSYVKGHLVPGI